MKATTLVISTGAAVIGSVTTVEGGLGRSAGHGSIIPAGPRPARAEGPERANEGPSPLTVAGGPALYSWTGEVVSERRHAEVMVMGMVVVLLVVGAVAAAALTARVQGEDQRSVARYRDALTRLGDVAARGGGAPAPSGAPVLRPRPAAVTTASPVARQRRRRVPRRALTAVVGVGIAVWLAVLVAHGARTGRDEATIASRPGVPTTAPPTTPTIAPTTTPTTTPPAPAEVVPRSADERGAVFTTGPSVSVLLVAQGRCWVGVTGEGSSEDYQVTLETGDQRRIDGAAPLEVRLGNPTAVEVFVDGVSAEVPAPEGRPFDLTFTSA
jgi:hypothetical protein